ncbi:hypothetical protein KP509_33G039200 [Ceratopteris richardii]|uniref:VQ domain-containing protein n=1 Tax=Ceratopteris richardii TaxID=49495 RepID=A0A8T2QPY8_CERRI|nr:hypothetical protein KP509_33G039200 [Ceratopteris richardii]
MYGHRLTILQRSSKLRLDISKHIYQFYSDFDGASSSPPSSSSDGQSCRRGFPHHVPHHAAISHSRAATSPALSSALSRPPQPLSSKGLSVRKTTKRKSRAVTRTPIRVLSADRESFRDIVQQFTGIPVPTASPLPVTWNVCNSSLIKPVPRFPSLRSLASRRTASSTRYPPGDVVEAMSRSHLPTLDTSLAYLKNGFLNNGCDRDGLRKYNSSAHQDTAVISDVDWEGGRDMGESFPLLDENVSNVWRGRLSDLESLLT